MSGKDKLNHRTVVGAILGGAGSGGSSDESLADALERVSRFAPSLLDEYHAALVETFSSGIESVELAESAVVLGLADLEVAENRGLDVLGYGIWAARANQRDGQLERAVEIADLVASAGVLSPELTAVQGECLRIERTHRRRRDQELLYARRALSVDEIDEARKHLGRALEHDPNCTEASQMLESLLVSQTETVQVGSRARIAFFAMLALALPIGAVSVAHVRTTSEYEAFERPVPTDLLAIERRIAELGSFAEEHPLWWGRKQLASEVRELEQSRDAIEAELRERNVEADYERQGALSRVDDVYLEVRTAIEAGQPQWALETLERTLAEGVPSAAVRARLRRDISAIRELLASGTDDANDTRSDR